MENVIPIIILLIIVAAKVAKAVQDQRQTRTGGEDSGEGWWEEEPGGSPTTNPNQTAPRQATPARKAPKPRAEPSSHVREILRQLQQQQQQQQQVQAQPAPEPEPKPERVRRYLDEQCAEQELAEAARKAVTQSTANIYQQSLAMALPTDRMRALPVPGSNQRAPIRVRACGRQNLRRAILIAEILGPPRAFDV